MALLFKENVAKIQRSENLLVNLAEFSTDGYGSKSAAMMILLSILFWNNLKSIFMFFLNVRDQVLYHNLQKS
jgi:hypothetical protein